MKRWQKQPPSWAACKLKSCGLTSMEQEKSGLNLLGFVCVSSLNMGHSHLCDIICAVRWCKFVSCQRLCLTIYITLAIPWTSSGRNRSLLQINDRDYFMAVLDFYMIFAWMWWSTLICQVFNLQGLSKQNRTVLYHRPTTNISFIITDIDIRPWFMFSIIWLIVSSESRTESAHLSLTVDLLLSDSLFCPINTPIPKVFSLLSENGKKTNEYKSWK